MHAKQYVQKNITSFTGFITKPHHTASSFTSSFCFSFSCLRWAIICSASCSLSRYSWVEFSSSCCLAPGSLSSNGALTSVDTLEDWVEGRLPPDWSWSRSCSRIFLKWKSIWFNLEKKNRFHCCSWVVRFLLLHQIWEVEVPCLGLVQLCLQLLDAEFQGLQVAWHGWTVAAAAAAAL